MAHFSKLNTDNIVTEVIVVDNTITLDDNNVEQEQLGKDFLVGLLGEGTYVQTSWNNNIRGTYGSVGFKYISSEDVFKPQQPYPSWTFNTDIWNWEAPVPHPSKSEVSSAALGLERVWNEAVLNWVAPDI